MSYNIDRWKTKNLDNLVIPRFALQWSANWQSRGWYVRETPGVQFDDGIEIALQITEGENINGILRPDGTILVDAISLWGEGSGTAFQELLLPALKQSSGHLEAVLVWEGGDSITRLIVKDGQVSHEEIEL